MLPSGLVYWPTIWPVGLIPKFAVPMEPGNATIETSTSSKNPTEWAEIDRLSRRSETRLA